MTKPIQAYILSYKGNEVMATRLEKQLKARGFPHVEIVYAPDMAKQGYRRNRVVYHTFQKYLLPRAMSQDKDIMVFEDDADVYSPYSKYQELAQKAPMNRIAWWKDVKSKGKTDFLVGSTIVSYKRSFLDKFKEKMDKTQEQHIDGFLTKKFEEGKDWIKEDNKGFGGTVSHKSYIFDDEFRKGNKGADAPSNLVIEDVPVGYKLPAGGKEAVDGYKPPKVPEKQVPVKPKIVKIKKKVKPI